MTQNRDGFDHTLFVLMLGAAAWVLVPAGLPGAGRWEGPRRHKSMAAAVRAAVDMPAEAAALRIAVVAGHG